MLYLNPPFPVIEGVALMPDHADPLQWYFMPASPRLSSIPDPVAGKPRPSLQMIKFKGDAGDGGFLNFDVNLGLDEGVLDNVKSELRSAQFKLPPGAIKLAPVPLVGGTVKMLILGQESPSPTPPPRGSGGGTTPTPTPPADIGPKFVTRISHDAHPSLYGDNQAAFSVMLDRYGVTVLEQALAGQMAPIGVVYSLDFLGLRPAYSVHLNIDWDRVQKHMDEHFGEESICTSTSIDNAVDELIDKRAIILEADTFVPEDEADSTTIGNRDRALNEVRDMITEAFFKPSVDPVKPDGADKMVRTAQQVCKLIATGGLAPSFSYSRNNYKRVDKKVLDVNIRERTTVKRSIYPQGHLTGLFQVLRDQHLKLSDFVAEANLNDPWFQRRKVMVTSSADFDKDSIESINVKLTYGTEPQNVILNKQTTSQEVKWLSRLTNGDMDHVVAYDYEIGFKAVDGATRPIRLKSPADSVTGELLNIKTDELFSIVPIPIAVANASLFPWDHYPSIDVQCEYHDNAHNLSDQEHFLLDKNHPERTWNLFAPPASPGAGPVDFRYRLNYRAADNRDYQTDWQATSERQVMIRDPFPQKRKLEIVPAANWATLDQAFVDLVYDDKKNQFRQEDSFRFSATENTSKTFTVDLRDPSERRVSFNATFIDKNGGVFEVPRSYTLENRLILRGDMRGHRVIAVNAPKVNFTGKKIKELRTELRYVDKDASLQYQSQFTLKSNTDAGNFEFDYVDAGKSSYEYRFGVLLLNGMLQDFDWKSADSADLNLEF